MSKKCRLLNFVHERNIIGHNGKCQYPRNFCYMDIVFIYQLLLCFIFSITPSLIINLIDNTFLTFLTCSLLTHQDIRFQT